MMKKLLIIMLCMSLPWMSIGQMRAMEFNREQDTRVEVVDDALFDFSGDSAWSIAAWIKTDSDAASSPQMIAAKCLANTLSSGVEWAFSYRTPTTDEIRIQIYDSSTSHSIYAHSATGLGLAGAWHHVVGTYDGVGDQSGFTVYVDGAVSSGTSGTSGTYVGIHNQTSPIRIGQLTSSPGTYDYEFDGDICDVRLYDRELTANDVKAMYFASPRGTDLVRNGLVLQLVGVSPEWELGDNINKLMDLSSTSADATPEPDADTGPNYQNDGTSAYNSFGSTRLFNAADNSTLEITSPTTICAWAYRSHATSNPNLVGKYTGTDQRAWAFGWDEGDVSELRFLTNTTGLLVNNTITYSTSGTMAISTWYHVAVVWNGATDVTFYVNGNALTDDGTNVGTTTYAGSAVVGVGGLGGTSGFLGGFRDLRIYDRAMSEDDINDIYDLGRDGSVGYAVYTGNLIAHWPCNVPVGFVKDMSGASNDGWVLDGDFTYAGEFLEGSGSGSIISY